MLTLPENNNEAFRLVSFDPGSSNVGAALLIDPLDGTNPSIELALTKHLKETTYSYSEVSELHGSRVSRLMQLYDFVLDFLRTHKPHAVIVEANYLGRFATSFAALVECVITIRNALYQYDPFIPLYMVDPTTVKTTVGMKKIKGSDKEDVRRHLRAVQDIEWAIDIDTLDEHAVDACAIGYYYLSQIL